MPHCETSRFQHGYSSLLSSTRAGVLTLSPVRAGARGQFTPDPLYYGSDGEDRRLSRISTCRHARTAAQAAEIICARARATRDTRRAFGNPALSCGGTKSSNPSPSSEESVANLTSGATGGFISAVQCSQGPRDGALRVTSYEANPPSATSGPSSPCAAPSPDLAHGAAAPGGGRQPGRPYS